MQRGVHADFDAGWWKRLEAGWSTPVFPQGQTILFVQVAVLFLCGHTK
jgi:hypothetical protein